MPDHRTVLTGRKKLAAVFGLGALMALAMPPVGFFPALLVSVPGFILFARMATRKRDAFLTGWAFGAGYFIFGLYWVSAALFVDIAQWFWVLPLSLVAGPAVLGLYFGFIPLLAHGLRAHETAHALAFVAAWSVVEFARGHLLTGFPWNLPAQTWDSVLPVLQAVSWAGVYGLSLLTLLWATAPLFARRRRVLCVMAASFFLVLACGFFRLAGNPTAAFDHHRIRVVQANIPQTVKWSPDAAIRNVQKHIDLSQGDTPATFVIWPETAVPMDLALNPDIADAIARSLPPDSLGIIGNLRVTPDETGMRATDYYNSAVVIDRNGVQHRYDKHHLVPFGEYIPFRDIISVTPLAAAASGVGDFTAGAGIETVTIGNRPSFSPLICYEVIFPRAVADAGNRPDLLVNVTNDAWYGRSAGPYQHLAIARTRAIEEGLPLARAANTGISAVIDPLGRLVATQPLNTEGTLDTILPRALPPTVFARFGHAAFWLMLTVLVALAAATGRRKTP